MFGRPFSAGQIPTKGAAQAARIKYEEESSRALVFAEVVTQGRRRRRRAAAQHRQRLTAGDAWRPCLSIAIAVNSEPMRCAADQNPLLTIGESPEDRHAKASAISQMCSQKGDSPARTRQGAWLALDILLL